MISNIIGVVEENRGADGARLRVLSYKNDGKVIHDSQQIKNQFPPVGWVFSPHFFGEYDWEVGDVLEFRALPNTVNTVKGDHYILDNRKQPKKVGIPIIIVKESILSNDLSINQTLLKKQVITDASTFYISNMGFIYGPFKQLNGEIIPRIGMDVNRYESNKIKSYNINGHSLIFEEPTASAIKIDCMTLGQLGDWVKSILRNKTHQFDLNSFKKILESQDLKVLDKPRLQKAINHIDQISLNIQDLQELAKTSDRLSMKYSLALESQSEELRNQIIEPLLQEKNIIEQQIQLLKSNINKLKREEEILQIKQAETNDLCQFITNEKSRLINELKVISEIQSPVRKTTDFYSYDEQIYSTTDIPYLDLNDFIQDLDKSVSDNAINLSYNRLILQLKDFRLILSHDISPIITIAKLSNNTKVIIQQVEPNWLRFENLFNNGLSQIWKSALENEYQIHFLVLQDFNIASIECYAKPLIDLVEKVRLSIPVFNSTWPPNLWIFGIPLSIDQGYKFGLPLQKGTFSAWGAFPKIKNNIFEIKGSNKKLNLDTLVSHTNIPTTSMNEYF